MKSVFREQKIMTPVLAPRKATASPPPPPSPPPTLASEADLREWFRAVLTGRKPPRIPASALGLGMQRAVVMEQLRPLLLAEARRVLAGLDEGGGEV